MASATVAVVAEVVVDAVDSAATVEEVVVALAVTVVGEAEVAVETVVASEDEDEVVRLRGLARSVPLRERRPLSINLNRSDDMFTVSSFRPSSLLWVSC